MGGASRLFSRDDIRYGGARARGHCSKGPLYSYQNLGISAQPPYPLLTSHSSDSTCQVVFTNKRLALLTASSGTFSTPYGVDTKCPNRAIMDRSQGYGAAQNLTAGFVAPCDSECSSWALKPWTYRAHFQNDDNDGHPSDGVRSGMSRPDTAAHGRAKRQLWHY